MTRLSYLPEIIALALGTVAVLGVTGIVLLAMYDKQQYGALIAITGGSVGALSSFLVSVTPRYASPVHERHHE